VELDLVFTLSFAALFLAFGRFLQARSGLLARSNIPAPAIGGVLFALAAFGFRTAGLFELAIDNTLRAPLQIAFFTTIGMGATLSLLRAGGLRMVLFWVLASAAAVVQNLVGVAVAGVMAAPPLLGVISGSLTLVGGPATGLAFTDMFERLGVPGAGALILASATFGILVASLVGNPVATALIRRHRLANPQPAGALAARPASLPPGAPAEPLTLHTLLHNLLILLAVMGIGSLLGLGAARLGILLPAYIGCMIVGAVARELDDRRGWLRLNGRAVETISSIALAFFFMIALMDLKLWQLAQLAVPMLTILAVQVVVTCAYSVLAIFLLMGRDYEAAVMTSGHIGFALGTTPNAVANMDALVQRFGPAPQSFLIVPIIGAFFIDLSNSLIVILFANLVR